MHAARFVASWALSSFVVVSVASPSLVSVGPLGTHVLVSMSVWISFSNAGSGIIEDVVTDEKPKEKRKKASAIVEQEASVDHEQLLPVATGEAAAAVEANGGRTTDSKISEERKFWEDWERDVSAAGYIEPAMRSFYSLQEIREAAGWYTIGPGAKKDRQTDRRIDRSKEWQS